MRNLFLLLALIGVTGLLQACGPFVTPPKEKLVIAIQPSLAATDMLEKAKPLEAFLETALGNVDVQIYVPLSQAGVVEALRFGHAHVAFMGAWPSSLAVDLAGAELALAEVRQVTIGDTTTDATYYFSYWVVPKASPYRSLADLRGKRACFTSPISSSGYAAPLGRLIDLGFVTKPAVGEADARGFFADVLFGGGYSQCWEALKNGQVDVSIIAGDVPEKLYTEVMAASVVLEKQGPIPSHGVVLSKELKEPLRSRAVEAIRGLDAPQHRDLMRGFISSTFVGFERTSAESHLGTLRSYLKQAGLVFTERVGK